MFVGDEVRLETAFVLARERLARLGESGALVGLSEDSYGPSLTRVGVAGISKLVRVQARELSWRDASAGLALRVLAQAAYRPALLYIDSAKYLVGSAGTAPEGYQALLRLLDPIGGVAAALPMRLSR